MATRITLVIKKKAATSKWSCFESKKTLIKWRWALQL